MQRYEDKKERKEEEAKLSALGISKTYHAMVVE
jgi:hypothetical protein